MKVLSAAEMQACDRATSEHFGTPTLDLMRAASRAVATFAQSQFPHARRITVLCGRGNNGGDGMMAARLLAEAGLEVSTLLLGPPERFAPDAATAWNELQASAPASSVHIVETTADFDKHAELFHADLLIDALLGTGFQPPLRGLALDALKLVQASPAKILAVDLPSGWPADSTAATEANVFPADAVLTFTAPKPAHLFGQLTRTWRSPVAVAAIGSPEAAIVSSLGLHWTGSSLTLVQAPRAADANKGSFGQVLVVGGSFGTGGGKAGAPTMAALAALRSGAGLVTAAVPAAAMPIVASAALELMAWPLEAAPHGGITDANLDPDRLSALLRRKTVLVLGPGLGQEPETARFVLGLLRASNIPTVLDADALNILAAHPALLAEVAQNRTLVLTPHPGEMARLTGSTIAEVQAHRLDAARSLAAKLGATVVLKGARTLVAHPDGTAAVNTTGNPAMAKGGSGDLLAGLVGGLLAQHPHDPARAVEAAVFLHGLAADLSLGPGLDDEHTLLATDTLRALPHAFRTNPFAPVPVGVYVCLAGFLRAPRPDCAHRQERGPQ